VCIQRRAVAYPAYGKSGHFRTAVDAPLQLPFSGCICVKEKAMSDDLTNRGVADRYRISIEQDHERRDWAKRLGVSEDELRAAVDAVGHSAGRVKEYLKQAKLRDHLKQHRPRSLVR
jgi:hypothetical protein